MTEYMLDTNICIAVMKGRPAARSKISGIDPAEIGISRVVLAELSYGVWKSIQKERNKQALVDFCSICSVWDWPQGQQIHTERYGLFWSRRAA